MIRRYKKDKIVEEKLCDYGCGTHGLYTFKNGKVCCSKSRNTCPTMRNKNSTGTKEYRFNHKKEPRQKPELCDYGCGQLAIYYFKTHDKWCCSYHTTKCPKNRNKARETQTGKISPKAKIFDNIENKICDYGCGQPARFKFKNGKSCCSERTSKCENVRRKNSISGTGKVQSKETVQKRVEKLRGKPSGMKGKHHSQESKNKIGIGSLKIWEENPKQREEFKQRMLNGLSKKMHDAPRDPEKLKKNNEKKKQYMLDGQSKRMNEINKIKNSWIKDEDLSGWELYHRLVLRITNKSSNEKFTKEELKQRGRKKELGHKQLDHNFSIKEGFKIGILPCIIGSKSNIRLIDCSYNYSKNSKCDITIEELFSKFDEEKNEEDSSK
jgi:hypothetical protein